MQLNARLALIFLKECETMKALLNCNNIFQKIFEINI